MPIHIYCKLRVYFMCGYPHICAYVYIIEFDKYLKVFVKLSLQSVEMTLYIYQYMLLSDCDYDCV